MAILLKRSINFVIMAQFCFTSIHEFDVFSCVIYIADLCLQEILLKISNLVLIDFSGFNLPPGISNREYRL